MDVGPIRPRQNRQKSRNIMPLTIYIVTVYWGPTHNDVVNLANNLMGTHDTPAHHDHRDPGGKAFQGTVD